MRIPLLLLARKTRLARFIARFGAESRGVTTIEFAMVAGPFIVLIVAIMTIGTQFMALHTLEHGVAEASRKIRTGEAQTAGFSLGDFRELVCDSVEFFIPCDERLVVHVESATTFAGLIPPTACVTNGTLTPASGSPGDALASVAGQENMKVLVTACYDWQAGVGLWQRIWNLASPMPPVQGKTILSAATVFQTEPYK